MAYYLSSPKKGGFREGGLYINRGFTVLHFHTLIIRVIFFNGWLFLTITSSLIKRVGD